MTDIAHFPRPGQNYPYVWSSSKVFLPTLSSAGKSHQQKERSTTSVEVFDVALVPLCCCVTSLFASPILIVDNRSQRMNLRNVLMLFRLQLEMYGNFFYIQIQSVCLAALPWTVWKIFHSQDENPFERVAISVLSNMLQCCGLNREFFIWLVVCQANHRQHMQCFS